ncbi:hypothetical protein AKJ09_07474 [Labilithrix luteola]|uniref:Glycosyltransferase RgtA/B/C/D-like domain-containing protein n=1 Tax=Labilithrix luteola TaxID=1391654 RepID=A0A0K1Q4Q7_9BACT|nr:hypothetical protein [Labilithrix luteola]AKV00811.1 hypothetical protein AKJ09_07474 [Labilithrix luteola]
MIPRSAVGRPEKADVVGASALVLVYAAACALVLAGKFDHVSDDDFARVTIAQSFVHAPKLDPSGTSWLPFPFWVLGAALAALGRSLTTARAASVAFSALAAAAPYFALRRAAGAPPLRAAVAVTFAMLSPWSLWLGASTVPESFTASFTAAAAIGLAGSGALRGSSAWFALALFAACLSRYEPWPVAAVLALCLAWRAVKAIREGIPPTSASFVIIALVVLGPLGWMAWNAHAHGSAVHFFHRVSNFKRAIGEGSTDTLGALLLYPRLLVAMRPDVLAAAACALPLLRRPEIRRAWSVPLLCAAAQLAFLAYGNARDGAPAHHAERALLGIVFILAMFAVDALGSTLPALATRARPAVYALMALLVVGWLMNLRPLFGEDIPATPDAENRDAQVAAGRALAADRVEHVVVTPCAYEHFALIAAYGAPERVTILPRSGAPVTPSCPNVERR